MPGKIDVVQLVSPTGPAPAPPEAPPGPAASSRMSSDASSGRLTKVQLSPRRASHSQARHRIDDHETRITQGTDIHRIALEGWRRRRARGRCRVARGRCRAGRARSVAERKHDQPAAMSNTRLMSRRTTVPVDISRGEGRRRHEQPAVPPEHGVAVDGRARDRCVVVGQGRTGAHRAVRVEPRNRDRTGDVLELGAADRSVPVDQHQPVTGPSLYGPSVRGR